MSEIVMPRLSDTMEEGTILRWLKRDGEHVHRGEELVEIETDKAAMTYESDSDGVLRTIAHEGDTLQVGEPIAQIGEVAGNGREVGSSAAGRRIKASPLARRIARERDLDLGSLTGSGPGGRIVKADVEVPIAPSKPAGESPIGHSTNSDNHPCRHPTRCDCSTGRTRRGVEHERTHEARRGNLEHERTHEARRGNLEHERTHEARRGNLERERTHEARRRGSLERKGRDANCRALTHTAHDRAAHGGVQGDDPRLHPDG